MIGQGAYVLPMGNNGAGSIGQETNLMPEIETKQPVVLKNEKRQKRVIKKMIRVKRNNSIVI